MEHRGLQEHRSLLIAWMLPEPRQWALVAALAILYLVSRTPSLIGNFVREFSVFIFP